MNINIKSLKSSNLEKKSIDDGYLYKDVFLDLQPDSSFNKQLNKKEYLKDIQASYDVEAIKTSIGNIFLTTPGQKILNPRFGLDLRRYLFEPVSFFNAETIKFRIQSELPKMEPRIKIENVQVFTNEDSQEYEIDLQINIPSLDITGLSLKSTLSNNGFVIL